MPTYRYDAAERGELSGTLEELLNMDNDDCARLESFLRDNNIILLCKCHIFTENYVKLGDQIQTPCIIPISNSMLEQLNMDVYEIINGSDALMSDFSSVYFDYMLLDKPFIFCIPDIDEYRRRTGLVLEPYDLWTPGAKVSTLDELLAELGNIANGVDEYKQQRDLTTAYCHKYRDSNSAERVWNEIRGFLAGIPEFQD